MTTDSKSLRSSNSKKTTPKKITSSKQPTSSKKSTSSKEVQVSEVLAHLPSNLQGKVNYLESVDLYIAEIDPRTLNDNPKNWRIHTQRQRSTYTAFKSRHGWLGFCLYNLKTSRLLDGHMRVEEAIKAKERFVPVILKYLSEAEENEILASLDNIGLLAKRNNHALQSLIQANVETIGKVKTQNQARIKQLQEDISSLSAQEEVTPILLPQATKKIRVPSPPEKVDDNDKAKEQVDESSGAIRDTSGTHPTYRPLGQDEITQTIINDQVFFPGLTDIGIPELLFSPSSLLSAEQAPRRTFIRDHYGADAYYCISSGPFEDGATIGTLGMFTEDHRFEDAYRNGSVFAEFLQELDPCGIITPDFSTYSDWPMVLRLYSVYRSRWCGRFWQELGYPIVPAIQALGDTDFTLTYVLETLPEKCPVLALQCRKSEVEGLIEFIKQIVSVRPPEVLLLYGGEEKQKYLHGFLPNKRKIEYVYLPQFTEKRRKMRLRS